MSALTQIQAALLAAPAVTALVAQRIYVDEAPAGAPYPLIVLLQTGNEPTRGLDGSLHARKETVQVESWSDRRAQAFEVHSAVEVALVAVDLPPEAADPDSRDPEQGARACVWNVDVWS